MIDISREDLFRENPHILQDKEMKTWWFAGLLKGAQRIALDDSYSSQARRLMSEVYMDLAHHWAIDDSICRRVEQ